MYQQFKPAQELARYIDAYWVSKTGEDCPAFTSRILPDTCTDIIINLGDSVPTLKTEWNAIEAGKCYLIGVMTRYNEVVAQSNMHLLGIRFKPFGMRSLLGFTLSGTRDKRFELGHSDMDILKLCDRNDLPATLKRLNAYFIERLPVATQQQTAVIETIQLAKGNIAVSVLSRNHFITERQLERLFASNTGVTVKEMCKQVRLQHTLKALKKRKETDSLLGIALSHGFYDVAHLSNDIKKYTGYTASSVTN
jgi:AraC-like DNA-binding protein